MLVNKCYLRRQDEHLFGVCFTECNFLCIFSVFYPRTIFYGTYAVQGVLRSSGTHVPIDIRHWLGTYRTCLFCLCHVHGIMSDS